MDGQDSWKRTEDIEIDLADLIRKLCMQWKQIFICAIAAAVIFSGLGIIRDRANAAKSEETKSEELTEKEQEDIAYALEVEKDTRELQEYLEHSMLMQTDPYHRNKAVILYSIENASRQNIWKITENYLNFVVNGGAADKLKESYYKNWDMEKNFLAELITAYQKNFNSPWQITVNSREEGNLQEEALFCVEVTGRDAEMTKQLAEDIQNVIRAQYSTIKNETGNHRLSLISIEESEYTDFGLLEQQQNKRTLLSAYKGNLNAATDAFSQEQLAVYQNETGIQAGNEELEEDAVLIEGRAGLNIKYLILGLAAGAFLYSCAFMGWYLYQDTVKSDTELRERYLFPLYGSISFKRKERWCGKRKPSGRECVLEKEKLQLLYRIRLACKKQKITKFCAVSDFLFSDQEKKCLEEIMEQLKKCGIEILIAENAMQNAAVWDELTGTGKVLAVYRTGTTTRRMIDEAMRFYLENGVTVIGAMLFINDEWKIQTACKRRKAVQTGKEV